MTTKQKHAPALDDAPNCRPLFPCGDEFKIAVKFWRSRDKKVKALDTARLALIGAGFNAGMRPITLELRRRLHEMEAMKSDGRWIPAITRAEGA